MSRDAASVKATEFGWTFPGCHRHALGNITLGIEAGQRVLVLGASGSGKTTLGLALAGLLQSPDDGVSEGFLEVSGTGSVGLVLQQPEDQTVMSRLHDDVAFGLENTGTNQALMQHVLIRRLVMSTSLCRGITPPVTSLAASVNG